MAQKAPERLGKDGRKLWDSVVGEFDLAEHERAQLEEACRIRDTLVKIRAQVDEDGVMLDSSQGRRLHPGIAEIRQQQLALARLLATLGVPALEEDDLPPSRGVRGVYGGRRR